MTSTLRRQNYVDAIFLRRQFFIYLFFCTVSGGTARHHTWETETLQNSGRRQLEVNVLSIKWITHSKQTLNQKKLCNLDAQTGCRCGETNMLGQIRLAVIHPRLRRARCYKRSRANSQAKWGLAGLAHPTRHFCRAHLCTRADASSINKALLRVSARSDR
jgi:hypothetical protein